MDNYLDKNRFKNLYYANAQKDANALRETAKDAGYKYLKNLSARDSFIKNTETFIHSQLNVIYQSRNENECRECLFNLKKQKEHIDHQTFILMNGRAKLVASAKLVRDAEIWGYVINGVGIIVGGVQVVGGFTFGAASLFEGNVLGVFAGGLLVLHGYNSVLESYNNIRTGRNDSTAQIKQAYIYIAKFLGFKEEAGRMAYSAVDLSLSAYGLGRMVLKPDAWCLFHHIPSDYIRNLKAMGAPTLTIEGVGDILSIKAGYDGMSTTPK